MIEKLLLSNHRLCSCSVLIEVLLLVSYRLCRFRLVIGMLLLVDYMPCSCCVVIGILLHESFRLCRRNALTLVCYYYSSLIFEVVEVWCTDTPEYQVESVQSNINLLLVGCVMMYKCNGVTLKICF